MNKYHNVPTIIDGIRFDSKREARRYGELRLMEKAGVISDLRLQVRYPLVVNGIPITVYVADFVYASVDGETVEDVKGVRTREFVIKSNLMRALHGIRVKEI